MLPGPFVVEAGRPVLVVPAGIESLRIGRVVVVWKDMREELKLMSLPPKKPGVGALIPIDKRELQTVIDKGKADPTAVRTLRCRTVAQGRPHQLNYIRDLPPQAVMENEPEGLLGESTAPNASEALLAAVASCVSIGIHANALARGIPIRSLELSVEADINMTAVWGSGDLHPKTIGFEAIRVSVSIDADASRKTLAALIKHTVL